MKKLLLAAAALGSAVVAAAPADAAQGCGWAFHRDYYGRCVPNGPGFGGPGLVIGGWYPGHGYWWGGHYWGHRYGWHHGWRYR